MTSLKVGVFICVICVICGQIWVVGVARIEYPVSSIRRGRGIQIQLSEYFFSKNLC